MATQKDKRRRDTPAQSKEADRAAGRRSARNTANNPRRDTPAQDRTVQTRASQSAVKAMSKGPRKDTPAQSLRQTQTGRTKPTDSSTQSAVRTSATRPRRDTPAQQRTEYRRDIDSAYDRANEVGRRQFERDHPGLAAAQAWRERELAQDANSIQPGAGGDTLRRATDWAAQGLGRFADWATQGQGRNAPPAGMGVPPQGTPQGTPTATGSALRRDRQSDTPGPDPRGARAMPMAGSPQTGPTPYSQAQPGQFGDAAQEVAGWLRSADQAVTRFTNEGLGIKPLWGADNAGQPQRPDPTLDQSAIGSARTIGERSTQGYYTTPDGRTNYVPGTQRVQNDATGVPGISVTGNMGAAAEEFARANAIRQQMIDERSPENQVTMIPNTGGHGGGGRGQDIDGQLQGLMRDYNNARSWEDMARIKGQMDQLQGMADRNADQATSQARNDTLLQQTAMQGDNALATTLAGQQGDQIDPWTQARAEFQQMKNQALREGRSLEPPQPPDNDYIQSLLSTGQDALAEQEIQRYRTRRDVYELDQVLSSLGASEADALESYRAGELDPNSRLYELMESAYGPVETQEFAEGGLVQSSLQQDAPMGPSAGAMSMTGSPMASGFAAPDPVHKEYQDYAQGAAKIGVQAIPFEDFAGLKQQSVAQPPEPPPQSQPFSAMGFAHGGPVPEPGADPTDVSGRMVMDPNPNAGTDSISAVIDGREPAKLDSGEFVIPEHAVRFHGIEKLMKLLAQAEQDGTNGTQQGSTSASGQVRSQAGQSQGLPSGG